jgi:hypothetical protein
VLTEEIREFFLAKDNLNNLKTALELSQILPAIRLEILNVFWGDVEKRLKERLRVGDAWEVRKDRNIAVRYSGVELIQKNDPERFSPQGWSRWHTVRIESLTGIIPEGVFYGVCRGRDREGAVQIDHESKISASLEKQGFNKGTNLWLGWRTLAQVGIPVVGKDDNETILRIKEDNHGNQELPEKITKLLWDLFVSCREDLERIPVRS